ncbi:MAG: hypothetical protein JW940_12915 [Polyangiaceae bacterium]|nr:hypothetical protein [Polyangiaceae bacterium]
MSSVLNGWSAVSKLLFPVKLVLLGAMLVTAGFACGYQPAYGGTRPEGRLSVAAAPPKVAHAEVVAAAIAGARDELSRAGVLSPGNDYPRLIVEVVRVDEWPRGISAMPTGVDQRVIPLGRATTVAVVGRAWVVEGEGRAPIRDTGDVRRSDTYATEPATTADALQFSAAASSAGRKLGRALARRVLGEPSPAMSPM